MARGAGVTQPVAQYRGWAVVWLAGLGVLSHAGAAWAATKVTPVPTNATVRVAVVSLAQDERLSVGLEQSI